MNGKAAIRQLLVASVPLAAIVPKDRIKGEVLPLNVKLPAIGIVKISGVDRNTVAPGLKRRVTQRIQVTIMGQTTLQAEQILRLVRLAAADKMPHVAGISEVTVHTDGEGPDFTEEDVSIPMQMQDFKVSYNELTI